MQVCLRVGTNFFRDSHSSPLFCFISQNGVDGFAQVIPLRQMGLLQWFRSAVINPQELGCLCPVSPEARCLLEPVSQELWEKDVITMG